MIGIIIEAIVGVPGVCAGGFAVGISWIVWMESDFARLDFR